MQWWPVEMPHFDGTHSVAIEVLDEFQGARGQYRGIGREQIGLDDSPFNVKRF